MLHYNSESSGFTSDVKSDDFFLHPEGRTNPRLELEATIKSILNDRPEENVHISCKFPARYKWLEKNLVWPQGKKLDYSLCPDYSDWRMNGDINGISLIFASGHLSNPASFYGHILLKFNSETDQQDLNLLDTSLNYGAKPAENENALVYIFKGLTGGYDGTFTNQQFYRHNHTYAENELRDLWNYNLDLSPQQIELLVDHSWELLGKEFTYYFLKQNCGYKMAELLNLVIDKPLLPPSKGWAMPSDMLTSLNEIDSQGKSLVKNISLIKSRQNAFRDKFVLLANNEREVVSNFIIEDNREELPPVIGLTPNSDKKVIDTLFDYYAFALTKKGADVEDIELRRRSLLLSRLELDTLEISWPNSEPKQPPHKSQNSSLFQTSLIHNDALGEGVELRFRAAYYDYLSVNTGKAPFTQMSMVDIKARYINDTLSLRRFDLLHIETLNVSPTQMPEDRGFAWKVRTGVKSLSLNCAQCLHGYISGGFGKAHSIGQNSALYGMITGEATAFGRENIQLKPGVTIGLITGYKDWWKTQIEAGILKSITSSNRMQKFVSWEQRFGNSQKWDVRLKVKYDEATEIKLSTGFYW